ncbi:MAG: hypothetical protein HPM95_13150 [Alphaproteobacteria bacterium]|nr:hypothetical protein [Alphaproteobacteria bacterium]
MKLVDPLPLSRSALNLIDRDGSEQENWTNFVEELWGKTKSQTADDGMQLLL